ncbi:hypothetical protein CYLTODRAFT_394741 [Cylindrobasidium torrendii FP15055 ss-10]|uniref:Autophagy-related protein 17 n=1 Tax=Cylindrobasidium torrendii FP15055 ss-10 TaxID=1314674 RepID=A0A0D7BFK3_9AGAR|nr:hypothetical protein CYLTODRAFT_394741 [Cylindrobasidium torrendii FP15055 ss-10]
MAPSPENSHLGSLLQHSKLALEQGEALCSRAHKLTNESAQSCFDVFALDAKVKWISEAATQQLKLAANVATTIQKQRAALQREVQEFDTLRMHESNELDKTLDSLGAHRVPPDFYHSEQEDEASSLFGAQDSDEDDGPSNLQNSPSSTVRIPRTHVKTLRDFIADRAVDEILDSIDNERNELDDVLEQTTEFPSILRTSIDSIERMLPSESLPNVYQDLEKQEETAAEMARHLESLAQHYDQMTSAMEDSERGEVFEEEDLAEMNRDTTELPAIIADLETCLLILQEIHEAFLSKRASGEAGVERLESVLDDLDELGGIMEDMLEAQESTQNEATPILVSLHTHVRTLGALHGSFIDFQLSFGKLLDEVERRRRYAQDAANLIRSMNKDLENMVEEERQKRQAFTADHGHRLPDDICLFANDLPTPWRIGPVGDIEEVSRAHLN